MQRPQCAGNADLDGEHYLRTGFGARFAMRTSFDATSYKTMLTFAHRYLKALFSTLPTPPNKLRRPSPSTSLRSGFFSHHAVKPDLSSAELRPVIQPRIPGLFVPSLPSELWLLILKEATYPDHDKDYPSSLPPPYPYDYPYLTIYNPDLETVSFLDRCTANVHRQERLAAYKADIKAKANLTLV